MTCPRALVNDKSLLIRLLMCLLNALVLCVLMLYYYLGAAEDAEV